MTIFILNRYFYPDHSATSQLATDLARELAARGWNTVALCSTQSYDNASVYPPLGSCGGVSIVRVRGTHFGRHGHLGRAIDYMSYVCGAAWKLMRIAKARDIVIALTDPPLLGTAMMPMVRFKRLRIVHWLQDVFPETAAALGVIGPSLLYRTLGAARNWSLRRADAVVTIGRLMRQQVARHARPDVVECIPNWALVESRAGPDTSADLRSEWGLGDAFVAAYSGNMGRAHILMDLMDSMALLRDFKGIRLLMVGDGAQLPALRDRARSLQLDAVSFRPYQPLEFLRQQLLVADMHIVTLDPRLEGLVVPSKFVGVIALGKPVLFVGSPDGELGTLIRETGCGVVVAPGAVQDLARAIADLARDRDEGSPRLRAMSENALALCARELQRSRAFDDWAGVIRRVESARRPGLQ